MGVALVASAAKALTRNTCKDRVAMATNALAAVAVLLYPATWMFPLVIVLGAHRHRVRCLAHLPRKVGRVGRFWIVAKCRVAQPLHAGKLAKRSRGMSASHGQVWHCMSVQQAWLEHRHYTGIAGGLTTLWTRRNEEAAPPADDGSVKRFGVSRAAGLVLAALWLVLLVGGIVLRQAVDWQVGA